MWLAKYVIFTFQEGEQFPTNFPIFYCLFTFTPSPPCECNGINKLLHGQPPFYYYMTVVIYVG